MFSHPRARIRCNIRCTEQACKPSLPPVGFARLSDRVYLRQCKIFFGGRNDQIAQRKMALFRAKCAKSTAKSDEMPKFCTFPGNNLKMRWIVVFIVFLIVDLTISIFDLILLKKLIKFKTILIEVWIELNNKIKFVHITYLSL